jgi:hypothetical protein
MKRMLHVCLLAAGFPLLAAIANASPIEGTWEGDLHGVKAISLTVHETGGHMFYIVRDEGSGWHTGLPSPAIALQAVQWDGALLRFTVQGSNGEPVALEMKLNGANTAELNRKATADMPEVTVSLRRR